MFLLPIVICVFILILILNTKYTQHRNNRLESNNELYEKKDSSQEHKINLYKSNDDEESEASISSVWDSVGNSVWDSVGNSVWEDDDLRMMINDSV